MPLGGDLSAAGSQPRRGLPSAPVTGIGRGGGGPGTEGAGVLDAIASLMDRLGESNKEHMRSGQGGALGRAVAVLAPMVAGNRHGVFAADIVDALSARFRLGPDAFSVHRSRDGEFLLWFADAATRARVAAAPSAPPTPFFSLMTFRRPTS